MQIAKGRPLSLCGLVYVPRSRKHVAGPNIFHVRFGIDDTSPHNTIKKFRDDQRLALLSPARHCCRFDLRLRSCQGTTDYVPHRVDGGAEFPPSLPQQPWSWCGCSNVAVDAMR